MFGYYASKKQIEVTPLLDEKKKSPEKTMDSMTAKYVLGALDRYLQMYPPYRALFPKDYDELVHFVNESIARLDTEYNKFYSLSYRIQHPLVDFSGGTGFDEHMITRKLFVFQQVEKAIQEGARQIIIFAGGYDPLAFFLAKKYPDVNFIELDRGQTRIHKINILKKYALRNQIQIETNVDAYVVFNKNLIFIQCDFIHDDLSKILKGYFAFQGQTYIVAEGLTSYLNAASVNKLLEAVSGLLKKDETLLMSFVPELKHTTCGSHSMKKTGESYQFALPPEEVTAFVGQQHFDVRTKALHQDLLLQLNEEALALKHKNNPQIPKCHFYVLSKSDSPTTELAEKKMSTIPDAKLNVPKDLHVAKQWMCHIL